VTLSKEQKSISLMETNLKGAQITLDKVKGSIKELETLVQTTKGIGKKELQKVIKSKKARVEELNKYLKEGNDLLTKKKSTQGT